MAFGHDGGIVCIGFLSCHSEPVTDVTGVGIRSPRPQARKSPPPSVREVSWPSAMTEGERKTETGGAEPRPYAPPTERASPEGVSKEGGPRPSPFGRFKEGGFSRGKGNRNPFPLEWRFWLLLSLLTKVTRRRQKRAESQRAGQSPAPSVSINLSCHSEEHPKGTCFAARSDVGIRNLLVVNSQKSVKIVRFGNRLPRQSADWLAMTGFFDSLGRGRAPPLHTF